MPDTYTAWLAIIADRLLIVLVIIVVCVAITRLTLGALRRVLAAMQARAQSESSLDEAAEVSKRFTTIEALAGYVVKGFVLTIGGLLVLEQIGLDVGPAIAGLGVVGIAIGFGAQAIVRDFFSGILILLENQYGQGDVVEIAGVTGTVEELTLRRTVLRDADGVVHNVPNGEIKVASNRTRVWRRINHDVVVAYGTDIEHAIQVFDAVGTGLAADPAWGPRILETPAVDRVDQLGERGITLKILGRVRAGDMVAVTGELRKRILAAMAANGIEIPAPVLPSGMPVSGSMAVGPAARLDLDDDPPGSDEPGEGAAGS
ncbi:MAG TPA: mechanosensitive ion channel family protein [Candidatus Limnocylindrales bacterium]|nr:mechanosensitive ion channel family protein [Candidatus Limnocylindrales bacterium]